MFKNNVKKLLFGDRIVIDFSYIITYTIIGNAREAINTNVLSQISYDNNLTRKPISIIDDIQNENVYCCI